MSSGAFIKTYYELNNGSVCRIRLQPETELATFGSTVNDAPAGPATLPVYAKVSRSNRGYGIKPRRVTVEFPEGGQPTGYKDGVIHSIVVGDPVVFAGINPGEAVTYLGKAGQVVNKFEESIR